MSHPWFKSPGNRAVSVLVVIIFLMISLGIYNDYRRRRGVSVCLKQGGNPVYVEGTVETPVGIQNTASSKRKYQIFSHCDLN